MFKNLSFQEIITLPSPVLLFSPILTERGEYTEYTRNKILTGLFLYTVIKDHNQEETGIYFHLSPPVLHYDYTRERNTAS